MLKFAANLSFLYQDLPFLDRFGAAANDGFKGVEYLFPFDWPAMEIKALLDQNGLTQVLFNARPGDFAKGERGLAAMPGREAEFRDNLAEALNYAKALQCDRVHIMAGLRHEALGPDEQLGCYKKNLSLAAAECAKAGVTALIEPINTEDMPGYFLENVAMALPILKEIDHPSLRLQFDVYHAQKTGGNLTRQFTEAAPLVHHVQIANPPQRFEPGKGEINYPYIFEMLEAARYDGWIGCEYKPSTGRGAALHWARGLIG
ncbi:MAG: hydroxypyruvate isomerase [Alphaproteobacteria bacterium]|nr:MAG: hydroxypyruvate isomerase [Alphaproteobacteria bacterium]